MADIDQKTKKPEKTLRTLRRKQNFLYVMLFSLVTIGIWLGFSIFLSQKRSPIEPELIELSLPLNPNINLSVLESLSQKRTYSQDELKNFTIYTLITDQKTRQKVLVTLSEYQRRQEEEARSQLAPSPSPSPTPSLLPSPEPSPAVETIETGTATSSPEEATATP